MTAFLRYFFHRSLGSLGEKIRRERNNNSDISQTAGSAGNNVRRRIRGVCVRGEDIIFNRRCNP